MKRRIMLGLAVGMAIASSCATDSQPAGGMREYVFVGTDGGAGQGQVTTYALDRTTGTLTQIDRKEIGALASFIAMNPRHPLIYVTDERGAAVHWVRVDPATGVLTPEGSQAGNGDPVYLAVDATAASLLAVNWALGTTDLFPLDPATGAITGRPTNYATGANTHAAVFHPNNRYAYAASVGENHIAQYSYGDGVLTPLSPPTISREGGPRHLFMHPGGDYLYAISGPTDMVSAFRVGADGTLEEVGTVSRLPSEFAADPGTHPGSDIHVAPSGRFLYAANRGTSNTLAIYSIGADGTLTAAGHASTQGSTPRNFAMDPDGELVLVGNMDSQNLAVFRADPETGALSHLHTQPVGGSPWFVGVWRLAAD